MTTDHSNQCLRLLGYVRKATQTSKNCRQSHNVVEKLAPILSFHTLLGPKIIIYPIWIRLPFYIAYSNRIQRRLWPLWPVLSLSPSLWTNTKLVFIFCQSWEGHQSNIWSWRTNLLESYQSGNFNNFSLRVTFHNITTVSLSSHYPVLCKEATIESAPSCPPAIWKDFISNQLSAAAFA